MPRKATDKEEEVVERPKPKKTIDVSTLGMREMSLQQVGPKEISKVGSTTIVEIGNITVTETVRQPFMTVEEAQALPDEVEWKPIPNFKRDGKPMKVWGCVVSGYRFMIDAEVKKALG